MEKMVEWVLDTVPSRHSPSILEVGSGNGTLLFTLHEVGYPARPMCGVDYSEDAVKLARAIAASRSGDARHITFDICDFLQEYPRPPQPSYQPLPLPTPIRTQIRTQIQVLIPPLFLTPMPFSPPFSTP